MAYAVSAESSEAVSVESAERFCRQPQKPFSHSIRRRDYFLRAVRPYFRLSPGANHVEGLITARESIAF